MHRRRSPPRTMEKPKREYTAALNVHCDIRIWRARLLAPLLGRIGCLSCERRIWVAVTVCAFGCSSFNTNQLRTITVAVHSLSPPGACAMRHPSPTATHLPAAHHPQIIFLVSDWLSSPLASLKHQIKSHANIQCNEQKTAATLNINELESILPSLPAVQREILTVAIPS